MQKKVADKLRKGSEVAEVKPVAAKILGGWMCDGQLKVAVCEKSANIVSGNVLTETLSRRNFAELM